jgi:hypothetical protein
VPVWTSTAERSGMRPMTYVGHAHRAPRPPAHLVSTASPCTLYRRHSKAGPWLHQARGGSAWENLCVDKGGQFKQQPCTKRRVRAPDNPCHLFRASRSTKSRSARSLKKYMFEYWYLYEAFSEASMTKEDVSSVRGMTVLEERSSGCEGVPLSNCQMRACMSA